MPLTPQHQLIASTAAIGYFGLLSLLYLQVARVPNSKVSWVNPITVVLESIGLLLRIINGKHELSVLNNPFNAISNLSSARDGLNRQLEASQLYFLLMADFRRSWIYPASQQEQLTHLYEQKILSLKAQEALYRLFDSFRNAQGPASAWAQRGQPKTSNLSEWRAELGVSANESSPSVIKAAFRKKAAVAHPDKGGTAQQMAKLNSALASAREELNFV